MEESSPIANLIASPVFIAGVVVVIIIIGIVLRMMFHVPNSEYKHKHD